MTKYHVMPADRERAQKLTNEIKRAADNLWELLLEAWNSKAHSSLGYKTWNAYVDAEFDFNRRQSYYLLAQARVTKQLRDAAGVHHGAHQDITVIARRDATAIEPVIDEVVADVREQVAAGVPGQEAVRVAVERVRSEPVTRTRFEESYTPVVTQAETCVHEYVCRYCGELA